MSIEKTNPTPESGIANPQEIGGAVLNSAATEPGTVAAILDGVLRGAEPQLTNEQREKVDAATVALAEKFDVPAEDFSVLQSSDDEGVAQLTVAYAAPEGLDLGSPKKGSVRGRSYDDIFHGRQKDFVIELGGNKLDSRLGMTEGAYYSLVAKAKARGTDPLPDSMGTETLLTGKTATSDFAFSAKVIANGQVFQDWPRRDVNRHADIRFRPAVTIE